MARRLLEKCGGFVIMSDPSHPDDEFERIKTLESYHILDSLDEASFDRITALTAHIFNVPVALITMIDRDRQWMKSCYGTDLRETDRQTAFCAHTILSPEVMVVPDAARDPRFANNPLVTGAPHLRFYAGAPLIAAEGHRLGSLCVVDFAPQDFTAREQGILAELAGVVMDQLQLRLSCLKLVDVVSAREMRAVQPEC